MAKKAQTRIIRLKEGDYSPEELSSQEHGAFIPFKVDLAIKVSADSDPVTYTMFLRAPSPYLCMEAARMAFNSIERDKLGITGEYPCICCTNEAKSWATGLTEDQYMEFWKEAQMAKVCRRIGPKSNPSWFMFYNDSPLDLPRLLMPQERKIISTASLTRVEAAAIKAAKEKIDRKLRK